jgi:hypothetical protein
MPLARRFGREEHFVRIANYPGLLGQIAARQDQIGESHTQIGKHCFECREVTVNVPKRLRFAWANSPAFA